MRYSSRLKYLQHCNSVIVIHERKWTTHLSHLLKTEGVEQNVVVVGADFMDVEKVMEDLILDGEKSRKIARDSQQTCGKTYGRLGAEVCYWRQSIRGYHSIMALDFQRSISSGYYRDPAKDFERLILIGKTEWEIA